MKRFLTLLTVFACLPVFLLIGSHRWLHLWGLKSRELPSSVTVELSRGESLRSFSRELAVVGVVEHPIYFELWTRLFSQYKSFQAGRYIVPAEFTIEDFANSILQGQTFNPVVLQFTIPEGFTTTQIAARLAARGLGNPRVIFDLCNDQEFVATLGVPAPSLEGYLYPATYTFTEMPDAREALRGMVQTFWDKLPDGYEAAIENRGLSMQEAVTFASLIELETHVDDERPLVSEVIWNRLEKGVPLAIDASIIYGIKDYAGDIKWTHLEDETNLYNTRMHRGLPPGPIGSPSRKSLEAVLTPAAKGNLYYVLDLQTGRHNFSRTLKQHNRYVQKMMKDRKGLKEAQVSPSVLPEE